MQEAFGVVIFVVVGLGAVIAVISLFGRSRLYDDIGRGGLSIGEDRDMRPGGSRRRSRSSAAEREDDIRQMLEARNARRAAQGRPTVDVEAELAELTEAGGGRIRIPRSSRRSASSWRPATRAGSRAARSRSTSRPRSRVSSAISLGRLPRMADVRRYELEELANRPGTYYNPTTEVVIVVDDSTAIETGLVDEDDDRSGSCSATSRPSTSTSATS